ncbi:hypothetical protein JVU11DRAFT_4222 [Chiua virens]|nr:hypothetical protein JVU11DRAFT_4222 [Chiua virens]
MKKYYNKLDDKLVFTLALMLHPYYTLEYIKIVWDETEEQEKKCANGNPHAKNWYDEALKTVKNVMWSIHETMPVIPSLPSQHDLLIKVPPSWAMKCLSLNMIGTSVNFWNRQLITMSLCWVRQQSFSNIS